MQAVVITRCLPGSERGLPRRGQQILQLLSQAGFETHLVAQLGPGQRREQVAELRGICRWAHVFDPAVPRRARGFWAWARFGSYLLSRDWHPGMAQKVRELLPDSRVVVCVDALFFGMTGRPAPVAPDPAPAPASPSPFVILDLAEPMSQRLLTLGKNTSGLRKWIIYTDARALQRLEATVAAQADLALLDNETDLQILGERVKGARLWSVADGIDIYEAPAERQIIELPDSMALCADLSIAAHERAAVWLARSVLPLVRQRRPGAVLRIAGPRLPLNVLKLGELPGVELSDTTRGGPPFRLMVLQSLIGIAPQRQARGAGESVLLALATGRPVVSTVSVATSLPGEAALAPIRADRAPQIVDALVKLMSDRSLAWRAALRGRELTEAAATWPAQWRRVGALLADLGRERSLPGEVPAGPGAAGVVGARRGTGVDVPETPPLTPTCASPRA